MASDAVFEALKALGPWRRTGQTSYPPAANVNVTSYFAVSGISVVSEAGFSSAQTGRTYTARITEAEVRDLREPQISPSPMDVLHAIRTGPGGIARGRVASDPADRA